VTVASPRFAVRVHDGAGLSHIEVRVHADKVPRGVMPAIEAVMFPDSPTPVRHVATLQHWSTLDREMAQAAGAVARKLAMPSTLVMSFSDPGTLTRIFSFLSQGDRVPLTVTVTVTVTVAPAARPKARAKTNRAGARRRRW